MNTFIDPSALVKRYVSERGTDRVAEICAQTTELIVSIIALPEVISALCRLLREGKITENQYREVRNTFLADMRDMTIIDLTPQVVAKSLAALERYPLRAMDAVHLAAACESGADLFVSSDQRQLAAAEGLGLRAAKV